MKIILSLLIVFLNTIGSNLNAQNCLVTSKNFYKYEFANEPSSCEEDDGADQRRCVWMVQYQYPFVKVPDVQFSKAINETIRNTFDYDGASAKPLRLKKEKCPEDKPGVDFMNYKVLRNDLSFLSIIIYKDIEPSGFGTGFSHDAIPFTFDLKKKRKMKLADVINAQYDSLISNYVFQMLKKNNSVLFEDNGELNNPYLFEPFSVSQKNFAIRGNSVVLCFPLSYGGKQSFDEIEIKFFEHPEWFSDKRLGVVKKAKKEVKKSMPLKGTKTTP